MKQRDTERKIIKRLKHKEYGMKTSHICLFGIPGH